MKNAEKWLREFDIFSKVDPNAPRVKTSSSGLVSILCFILLFYLFVQEVIDYRTAVVTSQVSVDTSLRSAINHVNVYMTLEFPAMTCKDFGVDAADFQGHLHDLYDATRKGSNLKKRPMDSEGQVGCVVEGKMSVRMTRGQFQATSRRPGDQKMPGIMLELGHANPAISGDAPLNMTHHIRSLSFGPRLPSAALPLDDTVQEMGQGSVMQTTYFLQIVPSVYYYSNGDSIESYTFSVTTHTETAKSIPKVVWKYDFSPYATTYREQPKSFAHFITRCCAVIGGNFVMFGLLSVLVSRLETAGKKGK